MVILKEDHINPDVVEVNYQTPECLKTHTEEPPVVVHDDNPNMKNLVPDEELENISTKEKIDMINMYDEATEEEMNMDIQVGPQAEIEADVETNPVDIAKMDPANTPIAGKECDGVCEFYVETSDVIKLAEMNETSIMEALNMLIHAHEGSEMNAKNLTLIMDESNINFVASLEECGVNCMRIVDEADDIQMDVQVGPSGEDIVVAEDPQEANPVDAVKRQYDSVVVAKQGDEFFTDVEDVQKCAELNNESVIETLNGIIAANEGSGMNARNIVVITNEYATPEVEREMHNAGVAMCESAKSHIRKGIGASAVKIINDHLLDNSVSNIRASRGFYNPIQSAKFNHGKTDELSVRLLYRGGSTDASPDMDKAMSAIKKDSSAIIKELNDAHPQYKFSGIKFAAGIGATIDVIIRCENKSEE